MSVNEIGGDATIRLTQTECSTNIRRQSVMKLEACHSINQAILPNMKLLQTDGSIMKTFAIQVFMGITFINKHTLLALSPEV